MSIRIAAGKGARPTGVSAVVSAIGHGRHRIDRGLRHVGGAAIDKIVERCGEDMATAVVLTAIPCEFDAVSSFVGTPRGRFEHETQTTRYLVGCFRGKRRWLIALAQIGPLNPNAALQSERAITTFRPDVLMFVGVAGGCRPGVEKGHVVVAERAHPYDSGKQTAEEPPTAPRLELEAARKEEATFELPKELLGIRDYQSQSSAVLVDLAREIQRDKRWHERIKNRPSRYSPESHIGGVASGEKVIATNKSDLYALIRSRFDDAAAVDMEGWGVLLAAEKNRPVHGLVVRGISDLLKSKTAKHDKRWQPKAAKNAAAFAFELLARYSPRHSE
jgi:nucleoside phosphorylase